MSREGSTLPEWMPALIALIGAIPGMIALIRKDKILNRRLQQRAEEVASDTAIKQFSLLYDEARRQITECRGECTTLRNELEVAEDTIRKLEARTTHLESELKRLEGENSYLRRLINGSH
jgi:septal ring factor EnvC (AmiA/AmiB activator)